ncbi:MAG: dihydrofolate reductase [Candidatus Levyibacteriota bacterium]
MTGPKISMVVAMDETRGIGKDNRIPWHLKEDLIRLKRLTLGHPVILGRTTYESMAGYYDKSGKEMPGKLYIAVSRDTSYTPKRSNAVAAHSIEEALEKAKKVEDREIFIIGGQKIFEQTLELADRLYLTIVKGNYGADAFFPEYKEFAKVIEEEHHTGEGFDYSFVTLEKGE